MAAGKRGIGIARKRRQNKVTKCRPNYGYRRVFRGWSRGAVYEADISDSVYKYALQLNARVSFSMYKQNIRSVNQKLFTAHLYS